MEKKPYKARLLPNGYQAEHYMPGGQVCVTSVFQLEQGVIRVIRCLKWADEIPACDYVLPLGGQNASVKESGDSLTLTGHEVNVTLNQSTGAMTFHAPSGALLLSLPEIQLEEKPIVMYDYDGEDEIVYEENVDGIRARTRRGFPRIDRTGLTGRQALALFPEEGIYGLGSHEEGYGCLRGKTRNLYQQNMKACVPALVSTKGWELVLGMGSLLSWKDDEDGTFLWVECADAFDFFFLYGGGAYAEVMRKYRTLTGETPLLPAAALGYIQSKERYVNAEELISVAEAYRRRQVPLDMVVQDWCSWPEGQWGYKVFDKNRFPDPKATIDRLHELGVRLMISIWPSMAGEENENRKEMLQNGCMLGNQTVYNAFLPEARDRYWRQASHGLFQYGVDAWWCDCTEPFEADWHGNVKMEESQRMIANTEEARKYFDPTKLSTYSFYHSMGIWQGQRREADKKRVFNLTRSSWIGQHRFGTVTWSGDISATWTTLRKQIPEGMNFCATGEAYWTNDIGAFFTSSMPLWFIRGDYNKGCEDLGYRELYTRWIQYAAFLPLTRSHGTDTPREIWRFGEKGTPFYDAIEQAIRIRYALFPYFYSMMARTRDEGLPMLRFPALMFPDDKALRDVKTEMMAGDALLVQPVVSPGQKTAEVYLPAGTDWYDPEAGNRYMGGQTVTVPTPLNRIPVFVKAGSIVPMVPACQHTGEAMTAPLTLHIFPGANGEITLYEDEGDGYGYEQGQCRRTRYVWNDRSRSLTATPEEGNWIPPVREVTVKVAGSSHTVTISQNAGEWRLD